jgi:outer membrane protein assembly factor BamB
LSEEYTYGCTGEGRTLFIEKKTASAMMLALLLTSMLTLAFNVQPVKAEPVEIIIDTEVVESRFTTYPPRQSPYYWVWVHDHDVFRTRAYAGNFWYTLCGAEGTGEPLYFGTWYQSLSQSGVYEVFVWIPNPDPFEYGGRVYTPTQNARYQIYHKDGMTLRTVNQRLRTGGWYSIGTYTFDTSLFVILNDRTGEPYLSTMIAFDAIKFVYTPPVNNPPYTPYNPSPSNHATGVSIYADLSWSGGDPDPGNTVTYDVYFGVSPSPPLVSSGQSATTYDPGTLSYGTTYYWKIVAKDNHGASTVGPVWDFTTQPNLPPYKPTAVSQYRSDGVTVIPERGTTPESTVVFKATVSDPDGDSVRLEIELRQMSEPFTGQPTPETISDYVSSGTQVTVTRYGLVNADYHWRYRAKDIRGDVSDWTEFGAIGNIDFRVSVPTLPTAGKPVLISPLEISPEAPYFVGDTLTAKFTIRNDGDAAITLDKLLVGGRFNGYTLPDGKFPDFTFQTVTLQPSQTHQYEGTLELTEAGNYHFFVAYYIENPTEEEKKLLDENNWNTCIDLAEGLTDADRVKDIAVLPVLITRDDVDFSGLDKLFTSFAEYAAVSDPFPLFVQGSVDGYDQKVNIVLMASKPRIEAYRLVRIRTPQVEDSRYLKLNVIFESSPTGCYKTLIQNFIISEYQAWKYEFGEKLFYEAVKAVVGSIIDVELTPISFLFSYVDCVERGMAVTLRGWTPGEEYMVYLPVGLILAVEPERDISKDPCMYATSPWFFCADLPGKVQGEWKGMFLMSNNVADIYVPIRETENFWAKFFKLDSPGELRVYDSYGRVTGLVNGQIREDIPHSRYVENNSVVGIFFPTDSYTAEVKGIDTGMYKLEIVSVANGELSTVIATAIPTSPGTAHQYTVDWGALSPGEEGVNVLVDADGDGLIDRIFSSGSELTDEEFIEKMSPTYLTYALTIIASEGGTTYPPPGTYACSANSTVQVSAIPDANYLFSHWELDSVNVGSANPHRVLMDKNRTLKAVFSHEHPWPMFRHNPQRTGRSYNIGPEIPILKWSLHVEDRIYSSPAIGSDGTIYVGSNNGKIYAVNPDGSIKWVFVTGSAVSSSPAVSVDGTIYVHSDDGKLYAINPDGSQKWSFETGQSTISILSSSPVIASDGTIYVGSTDTKLYALNPDGSLKWVFETDDIIVSSPTLGLDGTVYVTAGTLFSPPGATLYAINPDGILKWSLSKSAGLIIGGDASTAAVGSDGTIYVGSQDGKLYAINPDGSIKWTFQTGLGISSSPALGSDGTIYVHSSEDNVGADTRLYAITPEGGLKWSFRTGAYLPSSSPAIGGDGVIYIVGGDYLYAISSDGSLKWSVLIPGVGDSSPAIGSDGTIYVGSWSNLYAAGLGPTLYTFSIVWGEETFVVSVESNSTVSNFAFNQPGKEISFNVTGFAGTIGFCNVTIPKALLYGEPWTVLIDGASVPPTITENATHTCLYFTYTHSTHEGQIIGTWVIGPPPPPPTYSLTITTTVGGTTTPAPGTYSYTASSPVQVTAIPEANYIFEYWELDSVNVGSANPYTVLMDKNHVLKAVFSPIPPPLQVSISPLSASILVGQSVTFTSTVSGGYAPYAYQWYLNGAPVSGATSNIWTFTPTASGIYYVHLKVTDAKANTAQSDTARITVATVTVETATGTGVATFSTDLGTIKDLVAVSEAALPEAGKPNLTFPHGFFSFRIVGLTPGASVTVAITLPSNMPVGTQYWKYQTGKGWYQIPIGDDDGDNVITITLTDGGVGDGDGQANGVIVDPGGPGSPPPPPPVGGVWVPINKFDLFGPWIGLVSGTLVTTITIIFIKYKEKRKKRELTIERESKVND